MAIAGAFEERQAALRRRWEVIPGNVRGALWIMLAAVWFTGMTIAIKIAGKSLSPWQIVTLRSGIAVIIIMPMLARQGFGKVLTRRPGMHLLRVCFGLGGFTSLVFSVTHLDLTLATTLGFTRTLFVIVLALAFLGERLNVRRAAATVVGFLGVIICMQPGAGDFDHWILVGLMAAMFAAGVSTTIKDLTRTEAPITILVWTYTLMTLMAAVPAYFTWQPVSAHDLAVVAIMSLLTTLGQSCMVLGLRAGDASAVVPFDYSRLLYAVAAGFFIFGEVPTVATCVGAAVIIASTLYIALQSAKA